MSKMFNQLKTKKTSLSSRKNAPKTEETHPARNLLTHKHGDHLEISINDLKPDPNQPRKEFNKKKLEELALSIRNNGVLQPLLIRFTDGQFWIVAGERRYKASKIAELKNVPCIVTIGDPDEISLIENIQREDLTPIELAKALRRMMQIHNYNQSQLSKILGKSRKTVSDMLIIDKIPEEIKKELSGVLDISRSTMLEIARQPTIEKSIEAAQKVKEGIKSPQLRKQRQVIAKRSIDEILHDKMLNLTNKLENIEDLKRLKPKLHKTAKQLKLQLDRLLK